MNEGLCGWCAQPVTGPEVARRGDVVWHPDCFVKFLAHRDALMGIER